MTEPCIDTEQIATLSELPANDPRRRHAESCPRCRNLMRIYTEFLQAETGPGANPAAAREHLAGVIFEAAGGIDATKTVRRDRRHMRLDRILKRWWSSSGLRTAGLASAAAAVTLIVVVLWPDGQTVPPVLRDDGAQRAGVPSLFPANTSTDGNVELTWTRAIGADLYEVRVYNGDLDEIYRHPAIADTSVVIRYSDLIASPDSPGLVWRVHALRGADIVATSPPGAIPLP